MSGLDPFAEGVLTERSRLFAATQALIDEIKATPGCGCSKSCREFDAGWQAGVEHVRSLAINNWPEGGRL